MFGKQAIRLIREAWGGKITPDAAGAMREKGAKQLAEELYSMFDDDIPLEHNGPITINKGSNATPLTINNNFGGPSATIQGPVTSGDFTVDGGFTVGGGPVTIVGGTPPGPGGPGGAGTGDVSLGGATLALDFGDITINGQSLEDYIAEHSGGGGGGGGTTSFLGRIVSGTGNTYTVALYGNGSGQAATATVTATVPMFDGDEAFPADTWVAAVHKFTNGEVVTYEMQPPTFL